MNTSLSFSAIAPGGGSISASYSDASGIHTVSYSYAITAPVDTSATCTPYSGNPTTVAVGSIVSCSFIAGVGATFTGWSAMGRLSQQSSAGTNATFVGLAPLSGTSGAAALTASYTVGGVTHRLVFGYTVSGLPSDVSPPCTSAKVTLPPATIPIDVGSISGSSGGASGSVSLSGSISLAPSLSVCLTVSGSTVEYASVGGTLAETGSITATAKGSGSVPISDPNATLGSPIILGAISVGPIVVTPVLTPLLDVEATVTGKASMTVSQQMTANVAATYDAHAVNHWSFTQSLTCNSGQQASVQACFPLTGTTQAEASSTLKATVWFQLSFLIEGASGPFIALGTYAELDGSIATSGTSWSAETGVEAKYGWTVAPAGWVIANPYQSDPVVLIHGPQTQMSTSGGTASTSDGSASVKVPMGGLSAPAVVSVTSLDPSQLPDVLPAGVIPPAQGAVVDLGGSLTSGSSATLTVPYDSTLVPPGWQAALYQDGAWTKLPTTLTSDSASAQISASTGYALMIAPGPLAAPSAPGSVVAVPGNTSVKVSWTAPASNGSAITGYTVTAFLGSKTCTTTDALSCTVTGLTNPTPYTFSVTATNDIGTGPASDPSAAVTPLAPAATLAVSGFPSPTVSGTAHNFTVTAKDGNGATATGYAGTVHFTSSDSAAVLPADYTFTLADAGSHTFGATLKTLGTQSISATDTIPSSVTGTQSAISVLGVAATYHAIAPARVLDTRPSGGVVVHIGLTGPFVAGTVRTFGVANVPYVGGGAGVAVPLGATAVTGNLTITGETGAGLVALGPTMTPTGAVTTINFIKGDTRANNVTLGLASDGSLQAVFRSTGGASVQLIFDVTGYFTPDPGLTGGALYHTLAPGRVLDTRPTAGSITHIGGIGKFVSHAVHSVDIVGVTGLGWGSAQVPANAIAVTGNVTVTNPTSAGFVSFGPTVAPTPTTSSVNIAAKGATCANGVTVTLSGGKLQAVYVGGTSKDSADVIFDVTGFFTPAGSGGLAFYPIGPARYLDSAGNKGLNGAFTSSTARSLTIGGVGDIPSDAAGISANLTLVTPPSPGFAFAAPSIVGTPTSSTVNAVVGQSIANGLDVALDPTGHLYLIWVGTPSTKAHLQLDVTGYWK